MNCTAHKQNGQACKAPAIRGANVCRVHGGSAPQVKAAARRRLLELIDPALVRLGEALDSDDERIRIQAIREVLSRTGIDEPIQIEVIPDANLIREWIEALEADLNDVDSR